MSENLIRCEALDTRDVIEDVLEPANLFSEGKSCLAFDTVAQRFLANRFGDDIDRTAQYFLQ